MSGRDVQHEIAPLSSCPPLSTAYELNITFREKIALLELIGAPCYTVTETDSAWNVGEAITITTQGCGTDATCTVWITILNDHDGVTLQMLSISME